MFSVSRVKAFIFLFFLSAYLFAQQNSASHLIATPCRFQLINNFQAGKYYLQIGSYANVHAVYSEIAKIDSNLPVAVMLATVIINGVEKNVHRILIGPLNYAESVSFLQMFRGKYNDAFVWYGQEEKRAQERSPMPSAPPRPTASGLQYEVISRGSGQVPCPTDTVRIRIRMTHSGGTEIAAPFEHTYVTRIDHLITGLTEGLLLMNEGSIYRFAVPPHLNPWGDSTTVYLVELISILTSEEIIEEERMAQDYSPVPVPDDPPGTVEDFISDIENMSDEEFFNFLLHMF